MRVTKPQKTDNEVLKDLLARMRKAQFGNRYNLSPRQSEAVLKLLIEAEKEGVLDD